MTSDLKACDQSDYRAILQRNWRQGSILDPNDHPISKINLLLKDTELGIICTHSCSVTSQSFARDPYVEVMTVSLIMKYNPRSPEATGKHQRKLHIALANQTEFMAIECDVNQRKFIDRRELCRLFPSDKFMVENKGDRKLAVWLGRSYDRIALPDALVDRMTEIKPLIEKVLRKTGPNGISQLHESVVYSFLDWQPRDETASFFEIKLFFICNDELAADALENELATILSSVKTSNQGIKVRSITCRLLNQTFYSDTLEYDRYSDWDYLSPPCEIGRVPSVISTTPSSYLASDLGPATP